jgi:hypothetical protein
MYRLCFAIVLAASALTGSPVRAAECIDVSSNAPKELSGLLVHREFPENGVDASGYQTTTESAYIVQLTMPRCFFGDVFLGGHVNVAEVQLVVSAGDNPSLFARLHELVGESVSVTGRSAFGAHTSHHHAPVALIVDEVSDRVEEVSDRLPSQPDDPKSAVEGFYLALGEGDGVKAAQYVIPAKRVSGPLSAPALSSFYGNLREPLRLIHVADLGSGRYRASYQFATRSGAVCEGTSVVTTTGDYGNSLISGIRAENGC